jgi:predicted nucleic acid-binding protein
MIILDTNVVSETMKPASHPGVSVWLDRQETETLFLTATSLAELLAGIQSMSNGRRKHNLGELLDAFRFRMINRRLLPFDEAAANAYALLISRARSKGRAISIADGQIAAIAEVHGFTVATRDTSPFEAAGISYLNPWEP